ncbi:MAG: DUF58 domain-containing protein [Polyangiaceae bacterium]|nr:DUF58 domain-containing protein [Polyangiaceae bacterium]
MSASAPESRLTLEQTLDWGELAPLRLTARSAADGVYAGGHRSQRRGAGVEFGGHRAYVPGDDLRFIDRHALMRHGRLMVRQFETETDRTLRLVVDASASMGFRSAGAPGAKLAYAAVVAAALTRIAISNGDPVALDWIGGDAREPLPALGGREAFERVVAALETVRPGGDLGLDTAATERAFAGVARHARRGSVVVLLSDLLDLPEHTLDRFAALASLGRTLIAVRVLDPLEASFALEGPVRLYASEGSFHVETDASLVRQGYLARLAAIASAWRQRLAESGGVLIDSVTSEAPVSTVREVVLGARGGRP